MLGAWSGYYTMIGSSAAALTGLMFVVITIITGGSRSPSEDGVKTFSTPTVVHFCYPLFVAALMLAPFNSLAPLAIILGLAGVAGLAYCAHIGKRTSRLQNYQPDLEDWLCNVALPVIAYALLVAGALTMIAFPAAALYAPAAAVILLIFVGVHNAWDVVTFLAMDNDIKNDTD
jgi:hypothetical protein